MTEEKSKTSKTRAESVIDIDKIIKNIYLYSALDEREISKITEKDLEYIKSVVDKIKKTETHIMETANNKILFRKLADDSYTKLRDNSLLIKPNYSYAMSMANYFYNYNIPDLPAIYAVLFYFFGKPSQLIDNYKGSFRYLFLLDIENKKTKNEYEYILSIHDIKYSIYVEFYKIEAGHPKDKYMNYHSPFPDFTKKEMEKVWLGFFSLVKKTVRYFEQNKMSFFPFCKKIEYGYTIYGYKDNDFFIKGYYDNDNDKDDYGREIYINKVSEYSEQINKAKENCDIRSDISLIHKMLEEANSDIRQKEFNDI